jgi:hypothetical protein
VREMAERFELILEASGVVTVNEPEQEEQDSE